MSGEPIGTYLLFGGLIVGWLLIDLFVLARRAHVVTAKEAGLWSGGLIGLALLFGGYIWATSGSHKALEYYAGYLVELSLSVDNLFVFLLIFQYFAVPAELQHKVLNWGILGAMLMRGIMIAVGTLVLERFSWVIYLLGAVLVITAVRMVRADGIHVEPEHNPMVKLAKRFMPVSHHYDGPRFFTKGAVGWMATPLFLVVLVVEWTDVMFAVDSIPAIFAITNDPFIIYSSNIFAILGLRALFFLLADALDKFHYLKPAVAIILLFVGVKMILSGWFHVPIGISLAVIVGVLGAGIGLSVARRNRTAPIPSSGPDV